MDIHQRTETEDSSQSLQILSAALEGDLGRAYDRQHNVLHQQPASACSLFQEAIKLCKW